MEAWKLAHYVMYVPSARHCCPWLRLASAFLRAPHLTACLTSPVGTAELNPEDKIITLLMKAEEIYKAHTTMRLQVRI